MALEELPGILEDLGRLVGVSLKPDEKDTCLIRLPTGVMIQIEVENTGEYLIMGTELGNLPPGRYREDVFQQALLENGLPHPRDGLFAYSQQTDTLVFFLRVPMRNLTGDQLWELFEPFAEKAKDWKEAVEGGVLPTSNVQTIRGPGGGDAGMFGIRP